LLRIKLPIDYDAITIEKDGFVISKDGLQQKLATDAQSIINPFMYDEVDYLHFNSGKVTAEGEDILVKSDYFAYTINEKYGLMDSKGKMILRAKFDDINALTNDLFSCKIGEHQITMNSKGEEISK